MNTAGILILLVLFIPLTLVSLCHRKIRKYKPLKYDQYTSRLQEFKSNISVIDVTDEDIKKIKASTNASAYIIGLVIFIDIFAITLKRDSIFRQSSVFRKQTEIIPEHKVKYYASNAYKKPAIYTVRLGIYINNSTEPIVIQMDIPSHIFNYILKGEPWWIITYKDSPVTVIRG